MLMEMFILANGKMIRLMDMDSIFTQMVQDMKVIGKKTNNMEKEKKYGLMELVMKETTMKEEKMDLADFNGQITQLMRDNL